MAHLCITHVCRIPSKPGNSLCHLSSPTHLAEVAEQELSGLGDCLGQRLERQRLAALVLRDDAAALVGAAGSRG